LFFGRTKEAKSGKEESESKISRLFSLKKKKRVEPRHISPVYLSSLSVCKTRLTSVSGSQWELISSINMSVLILETGATIIK
jgi:hypothetical protein